LQYKAKREAPQLTADDVAGVHDLYGERERPMPSTSTTPAAVTLDPTALCHGGIDAAMRLYSGEVQTTVLMRADFMYEVTTDGDTGALVVGTAQRLADSVFGLPAGARVDASFTNAMQYTRLHVDALVYEFDTYEREDVAEQHRAVAFGAPGLFYKAMASTASAALAADDEAAVIFVFDGPKYYRIDGDGAPTGGLVRNVRDVHSTLGKVDAAVRVHDTGRLLLFAGDVFLEVELYGDDQLTVRSSGECILRNF